MKIEYSLLVLVFALGYALLKKFVPDIPLDEGMFATFVLYVLAKLGVDVVGAPVKSFLARFKK